MPLRNYGHPIADVIGTSSYVDWQSSFDGLNAPGANNYWKSHYLHNLSPQAVDVILEYAESAPSEHCEIFIPHMQGAISRIPENETAYTHREAPFILNIHSRWENPEQQEAHITWARSFFDATKPFSTGGVYVNFISEEGVERVKDAYTRETYEKLVQLKNKFDPDNIFRLNQNIKPTVERT